MSQFMDLSISMESMVINQNNQYELYSIIWHGGHSIDGGHYVTWAKNQIVTNQQINILKDKWF